MSKHTPGPWKAGSKSVTAPETEDRLGLEVRIYGGNGQDNAANARLIAAAPDLLHELKRARDLIDEFNQSYIETVTNQATGLIDEPSDVLTVEANQDTLNGIDAAIAKAKGGAA